MLFNSYIFVLAFLPLCIIFYFLINHFFPKNNYQSGQLFLLGMSLWFYGYFHISYLLLIIFSILFNYYIYYLLSKPKQSSWRKPLFVFALLVNIGTLFYFKYFNFFIENINTIFNQNIAFTKILLPLGISFFTFQQLSFLVDTYKKETPHYSFINYACFVTFFPQLVAGPIVTHNELIPQFSDFSKKKIDWENLSKGMYIFALGLAKKVLIADTLGNAVNLGFIDVKLLSSTDALIVMLSYTMQIYFDFSGYSDMAIGLGLMLNIDIPANFNSPYKACTIDEFWKRWHMTLTRFLTSYIYIPLGGNRKGVLRTYINTFLVFLISGIWHGANWTFILWGICHGIFIIFTKLFKKYILKIPAIINWFVTFTFINLTWIIFRADSVSESMQFLKQLFTFNFTTVNNGILECYELPEFLTALSIIGLHTTITTICPYFYPLLALCITVFFSIISKNAYEKMQAFTPNIFKFLTTSILLVWCIVSFAGISTFLYFNF